MSTLLVTLALLVALLLAAVLLRPRPERYLSNLMADTVIVNTHDGNSIRGSLVGTYADVVVLKGARYLGTGDGDVSIDGEAVIPLDRIAWIQRPSSDG